MRGAGRVTKVRMVEIGVASSPTPARASEVKLGDVAPSARWQRPINDLADAPITAAAGNSTKTMTMRIKSVRCPPWLL